MRLRSSASMLSGEASALSRLGGSSWRSRVAARKRCPVCSKKGDKVMVPALCKHCRAMCIVHTLGAEGREEERHLEQRFARSVVAISERVGGLSCIER